MSGTVVDQILRFVTLGSVISGAIAIYTALRTNNRRLGADIFLRYSDRIYNLRRSLPGSSLFDQISTVPVDVSPEERRAAREAIYSIFELYEFRIRGFIPNSIWEIWQPDISRILSLAAFRAELESLRSSGLAPHPRFEKWIQERLGE